jgi:pyruvate formate lyase activating enzyme
MTNSQNTVLTRRDFIRRLKKLGISTAKAFPLYSAVFLLDPLLGRGLASGAHFGRSRKTAAFWKKIEGTKNVRCNLCPRREVLKPGHTGFCRIRTNKNGRLVTLGYERPCVLNVDPVEKNPLFNFHPGMIVLSVAHAGCNLRCLYCQNWQFAQKSPLQTRNIRTFDSRNTVKRAAAKKIGGVSFTYTEPACCVEFVSEFADLCGEVGLKRTLCSAGSIAKQPFKNLVRRLDAVTITFKGPDEAFYRKITAASLKPVLDSMLLVKSEGKWLEVATLVVPTLNDDRKSLESMAAWIRKNLGEKTPWLIEKFDPQYKLIGLPPTPQRTIEKARKIGLDAGLKYVYVSNLAPHTGNHTYCPVCNAVAVKRMGFKVLEKNLNSGLCGTCGNKIAGVWA